MDISEIAVWSAMLGGLATLAALAVADALFNRSVASLRNMLFVLITSATCVVVTDLPDVLWPHLPERIMMLLKVILVPLSGAIALKYLDIWMGGMREDVIVHRITAWGAGALVLSTIPMTLLVIQASMEDFYNLQAATGAICMSAVVLGLIATTRASVLGDPLARWMVLACLCLAGMVAGLTLRALRVEGFGTGTWILTAVCTLVFFLVVAALAFVRNRQNRKLARAARLKGGADAATGLPTGSVLLAEVEHAFARTARLTGECTVVCLHVTNLYELGEAAGHGVENQILAAMAARIRRVAGFRCIVGLYHPRCFVVVISGHNRRQYVSLTVSRLRMQVAQPLSVVGRDRARHDFTPRLGVGIVTVNPANADPLEAINEAERQAVVPQSSSFQKLPPDSLVTVW